MIIQASGQMTGSITGSHLASYREEAAAAVLTVRLGSKSQGEGRQAPRTTQHPTPQKGDREPHRKNPQAGRKEPFCGREEQNLGWESGSNGPSHTVTWKCLTLL